MLALGFCGLFTALAKGGWIASQPNGDPVVPGIPVELLWFGAVAAGLFEAVRATPNVELTRIDYRTDGRLAAGLQADSPASLAALEQRVRAAGLDAQVGALRNAGGRAAADLTVSR